MSRGGPIGYCGAEALLALGVVNHSVSARVPKFLAARRLERMTEMVEMAVGCPADGRFVTRTRSEKSARNSGWCPGPPRVASPSSPSSPSPPSSCLLPLPSRASARTLLRDEREPSPATTTISTSLVRRGHVSCVVGLALCSALRQGKTGEMPLSAPGYLWSPNMGTESFSWRMQMQIAAIIIHNMSPLSADDWRAIRCECFADDVAIPAADDATHWTRDDAITASKVAA